MVIDNSSLVIDPNQLFGTFFSCLITNLSSIILNEPTDLEKKNPSLYIENRTKELTTLYKNGSIDINTFSNDLSALDSIDELIKLRIDLKEDAFGFAPTSGDKSTEVPIVK